MTAEELDLLRCGAEELGCLLTETTLRSFDCLVEELLRWNRRINLTAITAIRDIIGKHLLDSLTVHPLLRGDELLLDMGSGAGFPGFPLKLLFPGIRLYSVDAVAKKIAFQGHLSRCLGLQDVFPLHLRLEEGKRDERLPLCDVVVARALAETTVLARLARPCLRPGGRLVLMKGDTGGTELDQAAAELALLGFQPGQRLELRLPVTGDRRIIQELLLAQ